jgi:hypothetical protein
MRIEKFCVFCAFLRRLLPKIKGTRLEAGPVWRKKPLFNTKKPLLGPKKPLSEPQKATFRNRLLGQFRA